MSRSRMFGDETPEEPQNPSPRTTIVGGRPQRPNPTRGIRFPGQGE